MSSRSLRQLAQYLDDDIERERYLAWPPDMFALTSLILSETDGYLHCISPRGSRKWPPDDRWATAVQTAAEGWLKALNKVQSRSISVVGRRWLLRLDDSSWEQSLPSLLLTCWASVWERLDNPLGAHAFDGEWLESVLTLHAIADEAGVDLGRSLKFESVQFLAFERLLQSHSLAFLDTSRSRVLPKCHVPQTGMSLRSVSRNLAFDRGPAEILWAQHEAIAFSDLPRIRVLVLPWPLKLRARDFCSWESQDLPMKGGSHGFFQYAPSEASSRGFADRARSAISAAGAEVGKVDVVVFPELALDESELPDLESVCAEYDVGMFICGVRRKADLHFGKNVAVTGIRTSAASGRSERPQGDDQVGSSVVRAEPIVYARVEQPKHHRWCLDDRQVLQYNLGSSLARSRVWWEAIEIPQRRLAFSSIAGDLSICTLICEDLARQDPISAVIRSVGPSLVVALLMDGPQLQSRWPSRYATVLAEDPGSSVLTVSSLGMVERSLASDGRPSRVVAMWRDSKIGCREIALASDACGVVLSLCADHVEQWTADARPLPQSRSSGLFLTGVSQIPSVFSLG